ncbi:MAG: hypothetical protein EOL97_14115 [Spirochaetia bacterium]|jgi:hypothetical protein|nr:hypothetical protein [Spirochaetia bacterium]
MKIKVKLKADSLRQFLPVRFADGITKEWTTFDSLNKDIGIYVNNRTDLDVEYIEETKEKIIIDNKIEETIKDNFIEETVIDNEIKEDVVFKKKNKNKKK